jgi:hypothetical protein
MSDPSALNIPLHQALTSDMLLGLKPAAPKSRSYRISIAPVNKSVFNPGDQVIFELPTGRKGTWLDQSQSYLKFSVQFASTAAVTSGGTGIYLDNSAYSFWQRCDIYHSSNLLETQNEYGQLANFLIDTSLTQSDKAGLSTLIGTNQNTTSYSSMTASAAILAGTATTFTSVNTTTQIPGDRSGFSPASVAIASGISTAVPYTFSLPLLSGIIGCNASKMIPLGKLNSPIRVEMYLSANDDAIYYGTAGAGAVWQIVNVEFCACYVEIQDDNLDMHMGPGEEEYISTTTYRQASTYMPAATSGEFTTLLPFRAASITALYARFRNFSTATQGVNASAAYRKGSSINPNLSFYYFRIGSSLYPNKPVYLNNGTLVGSGAEGYAELLKSFHALSASIGNTAINYQYYNVAATATNGYAANYVPGSKSYTAATAGVSGTVPAIDTHANAFAIGIECQSFSNRNDTILSGISTLNSQIYFTAGINSGLTVGDATKQYNYVIDFFSQMDMILILKDGVLSARY